MNLIAQKNIMGDKQSVKRNIRPIFETRTTTSCCIHQKMTPPFEKATKDQVVS